MSSRVPIAATVLALAALVAFDVPDGVGRTAPLAAGSGAVELVECTRGKQAKDRQVVFRAHMRQIADGAQMQLRFQLSEKVGRGSWTAVEAPGIGVWRAARPDIKRFAYRQRVVALQKGTSYRVDVEFRWLSATGKEIRHESARSPLCRQPGKLPNPKIRAITAKPGPTDNTERYVVKIANSGTVTASRVEVTLLVDGAEVDTLTVGRLNGGARRTLHFLGPVCAGRVEARIDPQGSIREVSERDNVVRGACPARG